MYRVITGLVGLSLLGALFAAVYYSADDLEVREARPPAFNIAPGEVRTDFLEPSVPGGPITVQLSITGPPIDVYVMDEEWAASLTDGGSLNLSQPFNFYRDLSRVGVNGTVDLALAADGEKRLAVVFDHSDNHYDTDTTPANETVGVRVTTRYLEEEQRSLTLGYLAATPSVVLTAWAAIRVIRRGNPGRQT